MPEIVKKLNCSNTKSDKFYLSVYEVDAVLTETWLTSYLNSYKPFPPCYNVIRCDRLIGRGSAVLEALKDNSKTESLSYKSPITYVELLGIRVTNTVVSLYIPPHINHNDCAAVFEYLERTIHFSKPVLHCPDFSMTESFNCSTDLDFHTNLFSICSQFLSLNNVP